MAICGEQEQEQEQQEVPSEEFGTEASLRGSGRLRGSGSLTEDQDFQQHIEEFGCEASRRGG